MTLRLRLVLGFMLVSAPAMLASAYVAATLISGAFEANVAQWLGETSRFFRLEVVEAAQEARRVAGVIARRMESKPDAELSAPRSIRHQFELLSSVGYDLIAIYRPDGEMLYASRPFQVADGLPTTTGEGLFRIIASDRRWLMAGAVQRVDIHGQPVNILVGTWLDESYLGGIKVVTSLDVRLFADFGGQLASVLRTHEGASTTIPDAIRSRLAAGENEIFVPDADGGAYRAVYAGFRDVRGKLAAISFIGLRSSEGLLAQLGRESLFLGIFIFGSVISIIAGLVISGLLARPLRDLTRGVRAIAAGDFRHRVDANRGGREIVELASGFNGMAEQLGTLHELENELRRRDRLSALGQAAMVIAHEVRNPLGIIKTSTEVVRKRTHLPPSEDRMLGYVIDEVRRIETLVRDFLDFAQPRPPVREPLALRSVIDRVADFAAPEFARRRIALRIQDDSDGAMINGDADQLHQACLNLVLNAMDAMPAGGQIHVTLTADAATAALTIRDEGPGVAENIRADIFNPFFTTKAKGSGLGLAKVQGVAAAHGGAASCDDVHGTGASFTMIFPLLRSGTAT
ncbi:hypothetical protein GCM10019059_35350 [Camelimonas fluminis]|uniref:histidine kinase n=1 Tax=Camelimonas fluminis TaxID=1576911 RepID=A0ABV7UHC2_9HYPH|nr:ATP-binding protein [Camelimonas fluminis]GHE72646.1 hypothetical protein GCM10019059_35350 [Camelimonas fluminis]